MTPYAAGLVTGLGAGLYFLAVVLVVIGEPSITALQSVGAGTVFIGLGLAAMWAEARREERFQDTLRRRRHG